MSAPAQPAVNPWLPRTLETGGGSVWMLGNLAVAAGYFALAMIVSRFFAAYGLFPAPIWLPASVAMVAAMAGGLGAAPGIYVGAFVANFVLFDPPVAEAAAIAATNTAGPLLGAALLRHWHPRRGLFDSFSGVVAFLVSTTLVAPAITALGGATALTIGKPFDGALFYEIWLGWWLSDSGGTLFLAAAAMLWLGIEKGQRGPAEPLAPRELLVWTAVAVLAILLFLTREMPGAAIKWAFPFLLVVPIAWVALRMSLRAALTLVSLVAIVASAGTVAGVGPFQTGAGNSLQLVGVLVVLLAMTVLTIVALVAERRSAETASKVKSMFLATASHELRTPLNTIIGLSSLLGEGRAHPPEKIAEYARDIERSGEHLLALIDDLLDLSKIEAGRFDLRETQVDVGELVHASLGFVAAQARKREIRLTAEPPPAISVQADRKALLQILLNLLSNAIKFTPAGGSVTVVATREAGGWLALAVRDDGIGIDPAALARVFTPFERVREGGARDVQGTGLGLAIARGLAELHGGSLTIDSEPGRGTKATLRLPAGRVRATDSQS
ncbi:MAG: MASE1 domain-containing protein [Rhodospirillales bacterium]|nr:MASE1 domain-containing protein [Rhodospirillales bacterium]